MNMEISRNLVTHTKKLVERVLDFMWLQAQSGGEKAVKSKDATCDSSTTAEDPTSKRPPPKKKK